MLFPIFVVVTLLEIYVLATVGSAIGGFATVLLVVITALIGSSLLKQQGFSTLHKMQERTLQGQTPAFEMLEGVVIVVSGILLVTPGFLTDTLGLLGLMPWSRKYLIAQVAKNAQTLFANKAQRFSRQHNTTHHNTRYQAQHQAQQDTHQQQKKQSKTIEGEFWEE